MHDVKSDSMKEIATHQFKLDKFIGSTMKEDVIYFQEGSKIESLAFSCQLDSSSEREFLDNFIF